MKGRATNCTTLYTYDNAPTVMVCTVGALCCVELGVGRAGEDTGDGFKKADNDVTDAADEGGRGGGHGGDDFGNHSKEPFSVT